MTYAELKELTEQLQDLFDKGFIHPNPPPCGFLVFFLLRRKMVACDYALIIENLDIVIIRNKLHLSRIVDSFDQL